MRVQSNCMSSAVCVNSPAVSSDGANGRTPSSDSSPALGLNPTTPQKEAGRSTDPRVCVPSANGAIPAATATAEPLELPPGVCSLLCGLCVRARIEIGESCGVGFSEKHRAALTQRGYQRRVGCALPA